MMVGKRTTSLPSVEEGAVMIRLQNTNKKNITRSAVIHSPAHHFDPLLLFSHLCPPPLSFAESCLSTLFLAVNYFGQSKISL